MVGHISGLLDLKLFTKGPEQVTFKVCALIRIYLQGQAKGRDEVVDKLKRDRFCRLLYGSTVNPLSKLIKHHEKILVTERTHSKGT